MLAISFKQAANGLGQVKIGSIGLATLPIAWNGWSNDPVSIFVALLILLSCINLLLAVFFLRSFSCQAEYRAPKSASIISDMLFFSSQTIFVSLFVGFESLTGDWTQFRLLREERPVIMFIATCLFFVGVGRLFQLPKTMTALFRVSIGILLLSSFILITKEKIFIVPIMLAAAFDPRFKKMTSKFSIMLLMAFMLFYFVATAVRWYGPIESGVNLERFGETLLNALEAGFERHSYGQYLLVINHFYINEFLGPDSIARLLFLPLDKLLGTDFAPVNPMYVYADADPLSENLLRSSAHPTIFGDFFAQVGVLVVFVPASVYILVMYVGRLLQKGRAYYVLSAGLFIFIALIARGSSFYALYYLALGLMLAASTFLITTFLHMLRQIIK